MNDSNGINNPTSILFVKSGDGNNKKPAKSPAIIEIYAVFSLISLL